MIRFTKLNLDPPTLHVVLAFPTQNLHPKLTSVTKHSWQVTPMGNGHSFPLLLVLSLNLAAMFLLFTELKVTNFTDFLIIIIAVVLFLW